MDIPILHHKFDATGVGLHLSDTHMEVFFIISVITLFAIMFLFAPLNIEGLSKKQEKKQSKKKSRDIFLSSSS